MDFVFGIFQDLLKREPINETQTDQEIEEEQIGREQIRDRGQ